METAAAGAAAHRLAAGVASLLAASVIGAEVLDRPLSVLLEEPAQDGSSVW